jgi:DNA-binding MarR family transcriptional regulator
MPITRDEFETAESTDRGRSTAEAIVDFLVEHDDMAFTRGEIAEAVDRDPNTVSTNLTRLKSRGFVEHRGQYWAITTDSDRLAELLETMESIPGEPFEDEEPFIRDDTEAEEWADAAADHDEGPSSNELAGRHSEGRSDEKSDTLSRVFDTHSSDPRFRMLPESPKPAIVEIDTEREEPEQSDY